MRAASLISIDTTPQRVALVLVVILTTATAAAVNVAGGLGQAWAVVRAGGRAVVQLLLVKVR